MEIENKNNKIKAKQNNLNKNKIQFVA